MIQRRYQKLASPLVWLPIIILNFTLADSFSISSSLSSTNNGLTSSTLSSRSNQMNAQLLQQTLATQAAGQQQQTTTLPPLITTISQNMYLDNFSHHQQQQQQLSSNKIGQPEMGSAHEGNELRSNIEEHEDSVPLATVNNHSKNNQPAPRPPQYVDVSALVGTTQTRDRNMTGTTPSSSLAGLSNSMTTQSGSVGLSAKSRSGLPECATQQVCNAIFVRMNYTQKLCECSSNYNWKCSNNLDPQDGHTIELTRKFDKRIYTQIKTCEPLREVRACKSPTDWTLLALQSERSGKAHYVVVCKCPTWAQLEGPYTHNHPPYANIPGIRVYGMLCAHQTARSSAQTYATYNPALNIYPEFPWSEALSVLNTTNSVPSLNSY